MFLHTGICRVTTSVRSFFVHHVLHPGICVVRSRSVCPSNDRLGLSLALGGRGALYVSATPSHEEVSYFPHQWHDDRLLLCIVEDSVQALFVSRSKVSFCTTKQRWGDTLVLYRFLVREGSLCYPSSFLYSSFVLPPHGAW